MVLVLVKLVLLQDSLFVERCLVWSLQLDMPWKVAFPLALLFQKLPLLLLVLMLTLLVVLVLMLLRRPLQAGLLVQHGQQVSIVLSRGGWLHRCALASLLLGDRDVRKQRMVERQHS